jgi:hypothetical protein
MAKAMNIKDFFLVITIKEDLKSTELSKTPKGEFKLLKT